MAKVLARHTFRQRIIGYLVSHCNTKMIKIEIVQVQTVSTASNSDIVLPAIGQRKTSNTTIRKKSTPKMISAKRHFELYGSGDYRTQMFLKMLQQTLGDEHYLLHDKLIKV